MNDFDKKFLLRCKKCGHEFYPWKCLTVTSDKTQWKEFIYCPKCNNFEKKESFKID